MTALEHLEMPVAVWDLGCKGALVTLGPLGECPGLFYSITSAPGFSMQSTALP